MGLNQVRSFTTFPLLARGLANLAAGDGRVLFEMEELPPFQCPCDGEPTRIDLGDETYAAIMCNDGVDISGSLEDFQNHVEILTHKSSWGELWSSIRADFIGWPKLPKSHYREPFVGNTSFPILLIGNTANPTAPLWAAEKISKGYPGSVVLVQDSPGHSPLAAPSLCTQKYVRAYFTDGTPSKRDTVCSVDRSPFLRPIPGVTADQTFFEDNLTPDEREILTAVIALSVASMPPVSYPL